MATADQPLLSPVARCLLIAAQRGRTLRLAREAAQRDVGDETQPAAGQLGGISADMILPSSNDVGQALRSAAGDEAQQAEPAG